jgi:hypothetical protein
MHFCWFAGARSLIPVMRSFTSARLLVLHPDRLPAIIHNKIVSIYAPITSNIWTNFWVKTPNHVKHYKQILQQHIVQTTALGGRDHQKAIHHVTGISFPRDGNAICGDVCAVNQLYPSWLGRWQTGSSY